MKIKAIILLISLQLVVRHSSAQWQMHPDTSSFYSGYYSSISFISDSVGFLVGCSEFSAWNSIGLLKTTDKGNSWIAIKGTSGGGCYIPNFFTDDNIGYCIITYGTSQPNELQKTTDGGLNWSQPDTTGSFNMGTTFSNDNVYFINPTLGFVAKNNNIFRTINGGKSWQMVNSTHFINTFYFTSPQTGYAAGDKIIMKTTDGGNSWSVKDTSYFVSSLFFPTANIGYAAGKNGVILKTMDAANTWSPQVTAVSNSIALNSIFCLNNNMCYAVGDGGIILHTANGGSTWTKQNSGVTVKLNSVSCTDINCFAVGDTSVLLKTTIGTTGIQANSRENDRLLIYPNPFSFESILKTNTAFKNATIMMYNAQGQEVKKLIKITGQEIKIQRDNLPSGVYLICLAQEDVRSTIKLVITDQ